MKPVARVDDMHTCPKTTNKKAHVGGKIIEGSKTVMIDGKPVALKGSKLECTGVGATDDVIAEGSSVLIIDGKPVARKGDKTAHGGVITEGSPTVKIG